MCGFSTPVNESWLKHVRNCSDSEESGTSADTVRAQQLMAKGPIWLVRRVMELEA